MLMTPHRPRRTPSRGRRDAAERAAGGGFVEVLLRFCLCTAARYPYISSCAVCQDNTGNGAMSSSSSDADGSIAGAGSADAPRLAKRVCRRLQRSLKQPLPTADHRSVVEAMEALANHLSERVPAEPPPAEVPMALRARALRRCADWLERSMTTKRARRSNTRSPSSLCSCLARASREPHTPDPATGDGVEGVERAGRAGGHV